MKNINVIDLDNTLIPYDSFGKLVKNEILNVDFKIAYYTGLRICRIITLENFKKRIFQIVMKKYDNTYLRNLAQNIVNDINHSVLREIDNTSNGDSINVLISASPDCYVKHIVEILGWQGKGSFFDNEGNFTHLFGKNKVLWILSNFPREEYQYNFAISDSDTDDELLKLFNYRKKWILH